MKEFLVVVKQSGGCDYTIGCGIVAYFIKAKDMEAALEEVMGTKDIKDTDIDDMLEDEDYEHNGYAVYGDYGSPYHLEEMGIESITISEVIETLDVDLDPYLQKIEKMRELKNKRETEEEELETYKKLKAKFEHVK